MKNYNITLDEDVRAILANSTITDTTVALPPGQLPRPLYERVNKALVAAGGKWNRRSKAHLFTRDPRVALGLAIANGEITDNANRLQQFFTPCALAERLAAMANIEACDTVLEPSAGRGALALAARRRSGIVRCVEIDPVLGQALTDLGFPTLVQDFLTTFPVPTYNVVLMNPPFANGQDIAHITHALKFLRPGGRLVSVASRGIDFNETKKYQAFRALVKDRGGRIVDLPDGSFTESDTNVRSSVVVI